MSLREVIASLPVYGQPVGQVTPKTPKVERIDSLRTAARRYPCVLCGKNKEFTVAAHCNAVQFKGMGKKAPAWMVAYVCGDPGGCHDIIDGRAGKLSKEKKRGLWLEAYWLTVQLWFRDGLVRPA